MARIVQSFHFTYWDWIKEEIQDVPAGTTAYLDGVPVTITEKGVFPETVQSAGGSGSIPVAIAVNHINGSAEYQIRYTVTA
jgi:hypothetical protein